MSRRGISFLKKVALVAAALMLMTSQLLAGDRVHSANRPNHSNTNPPAPVPVFRAGVQPVTISFVVASPQSAAEPVYVDLRGPDGQVRRFPVEGGREAIQYQQTVVLRPGGSLTIQWVAAK
jgi:hypothetical protein